MLSGCHGTREAIYFQNNTKETIRIKVYHIESAKRSETTSVRARDILPGLRVCAAVEWNPQGYQVEISNRDGEILFSRPVLPTDASSHGYLVNFDGSGG